MNINWHNIDYLKEGNMRQKECFSILQNLRILDVLSAYNPIVVGTIPIGIDVVDSDIDIVCCSQNLEELQNIVTSNYSDFLMYSDNLQNGVFVANFSYCNQIIEIYASQIPTAEQNGYKHMLIEDRILRLANNKFREDIINLKEQGIKTEPAFGILLNLESPYEALLNLDKLTDKELTEILISCNIPPCNNEI